MSDGQQKVIRRRVFYIPGYDPISPRRYRELYRTEGAGQAAISGYTLTLAPKSGGGRYGWHVEAEIEGVKTKTDFEVLVWSDIVKSSMEMNIPMTYLLMVRTAWTYISSGTFWQLMKTRKGPVIAALYPILMLVLQLVLALLLAWLAAAFSALLHPWASWPVALVVIVLTLRYFRKIDSKLFVYYLMHDYSYAARSRGANPPELETRISEFADEISTALKDEVDEVLVVGHSSGASLGVSILADVIRDGDVSMMRPALSFLTLGQVVPMVSFLPKAYRLRADLNYLSAREELTWVDVTAPGDGCAFALCDPVSVSGVAPEGKRWPLVLSAAFSQTLSPERWKELRWRFFRLHFQYLCAFDQPGDYDYFQITAGSETLASRFAGRAPSTSRIEASLSPYPEMTA